MKFKRSEMWLNGKKNLLEDVIRGINPGVLSEWIIYEFAGVGDAPNGMPMVNFESQVRDSGSGYHMTDAELRRFSRSLSDITDIKLCGFLGGRKVIDIDGFDSQYWDVWVDESLVESLPRRD